MEDLNIATMGIIPANQGRMTTDFTKNIGKFTAALWDGFKEGAHDHLPDSDSLSARAIRKPHIRGSHLR